MAILKCCLNFFMMQIWTCLEVCYIAPAVFTSYFPHWSLYQWNSALLTVLLLSPTATITSTNIHLFCGAFLMEHINWLCCCLHRYSIISHSSRISFFFVFFPFFFPVMLYCSYTLMFSLFYSIVAMLLYVVLWHNATQRCLIALVNAPAAVRTSRCCQMDVGLHKSLQYLSQWRWRPDANHLRNKSQREKASGRSHC